MEKGMLLLIAGSSGSGKNTLINQLLSTHDDVKFLVSNTTREIRDGEKDGVTYHFVSVEEFKRAIDNNEMLEYDFTHKGYYGISKRTIDEALLKSKVVVKDISVLGVVNCKKQLSHRILINSVFLTESKRVLKKRLIGRGEKNWRLRLKIYHQEQSQMGICDYIIKNSQLNNSLSIVEAIINHGTNNLPLTPLKKFKKVNECKLNYYAQKIEQGDKIKPLKVTVINNEIYLLDTPEKYLASLKVKKSWPKRFINKTFKPKVYKTGEQNAWANEFRKYSV